jgi:hypothetical protein
MSISWRFPVLFIYLKIKDCKIRIQNIIALYKEDVNEKGEKSAAGAPARGNAAARPPKAVEKTRKIPVDNAAKAC